MPGTVCVYPDSGRTPAAVHSINNFVADLKKGVEGKGC